MTTVEKCDRSLAQTIFNNTRTVNINGLDIEIKDVPDSDRPGMFDKREYLFRKAFFELQKLAPPAAPDIAQIRSQTKTFCYDLCDGEVAQSSFVLDSHGRHVAVSVYSSASDKTSKPALIYIHGGSFFAGCAASYSCPCMFIAQEADCVVFNIDYSLAPENPYPAAIEDCLALVSHIYDNSEMYGVDKCSISLSGDSAGGNLALACALNCPENIKLRYLGLFYPCVDLYSREGFYDWKESDFEMDDEHREVIVSRLSLGRSDGKGANSFMDLLTYCYTGTNDPDFIRRPDISMVYADVSRLPKCTIFTAEFDGLRPQAEYFSRLLNKAGIENRLVRYRGVSHAFLDYFGVLPQAEAAVLELIAEIKSL